MKEPIQSPQLFALTRKADSHQVMGYGLVLPDGSRYSVSWPAGLTASIYSTTSAKRVRRTAGR